METPNQVSEWLAAGPSDRTAVDHLFQLGPEDRVALKPLHDVVSDASHPHRWLAARTLGQLRAADSVPFLVRALDADDPDLRSHAALALGQIGDPTAVDRLTTALADPHPRARVAAASAVLLLGGAPAARDVLVAVDRADLVTSHWALHGLIDALPLHPSLLLDLVAALDHPDDAFVELASSAIAGLPPADTVPLLLRTLSEGISARTRGVLHALAEIGPTPHLANVADVAEVLLSAGVFTAHDLRIRVASARVAERTRLDHAGVVQALVHLLDDDPWAQESAALALLALPSASPPARERARRILLEDPP